MTIKSFLSKYAYEFLALFVCLIIGITNYVPDHYLTGWDNLQTELEPILAIKRAFFSGWQEYQSFGLISGMAHAADLIRSLYQNTLTTFLPNHAVRFVTQLLVLCAGTLGSLKLIYFLMINKTSTYVSKLFPFLGSLLYLLNYGTIQILSLSYEPFSWFFAVLPWLLYFYTKILRSSVDVSRSDIVLFIVVNLLATPAFYVQTQFVVYGIGLTALTIGHIIMSKTRLDLLKRSLFLSLTILLVNSFWLLPQLYFLKNNGTEIVTNAKSNTVSTEDTFYQNLEKGTLYNYLTFRGLYDDLYTLNNKHIFNTWNKYHQNPAGMTAQWLVVAINLLGIILSIKKKKNIPFLIIYLFVAIALLSNTFLIDQINELLRKLPIIYQIFRSPFTKFVVPYSLVASIFFTAGLIFIREILSKKNRHSHIIVGLLAGILLLTYALPAFRGYYFAPSTKVVIPKDYFQLFDYFKTQPKNSRIGLLPEYTFWGWFRTNWGYDGSGFLWYGIEQPIVSRTFDVWSSDSEGYYWELKYALSKNDPVMLKNVLDKYRIDYLVVDNTLLAVGTSYKTLRYNDLYELLESTEGILKSADFGKLTVYTVSHDIVQNNFVSLISDVSKSGPSVKMTNYDASYYEYGDYYTDLSEKYKTYFPFKNLFSQTQNIDKKWSIYDSIDSIFVQSEIEDKASSDNLVVSDTDFEYETYVGNQTNINHQTVNFITENNSLIAEIPKVKITDLNLDKGIQSDCGINKGQRGFEKTSGGFTFYANNGASACIGIDLPRINQKYGYLLRISNKHVEGRKLFFYILDKTHYQPVIEDLLTEEHAYYFIPSGSDYSLGYSITFQNNSNIGLPSINSLETLELYAFPIDILQSSYLTDKNTDVTLSKPSSTLRGVSVEKKNYFQYLVSIEGVKNADKYNILTLWQAHDKGWQAYEVQSNSPLSHYFPWFFGQKFENHVLVNNWANGWEIIPCNTKHVACNSEVIIIFWPQYLQFLGFGLLIFAFIGIFLYKDNKSHSTLYY